ncbi:MAG: hypothetical protein AAF065_00630 [Verrucomicrobiota bacterium]
MDNLLEILVPLIFAAIYFFGNMFSGKSQDDDAPSGTPRRGRAKEEDADAVERQRRIQEEIRRKIMERRRVSEQGEQPQPVPTGQELRERRREIEVRRETREVRKETREVVHESQEVPPFVVPTHEATTEPTPPAFSWEQSDNAYETAMQEQLKRIEATKRQAEQLKRQANASHKRSEASKTTRSSKTGRYFSGPVRESLQDPAAARAAFIYAEVLGQPISMRKGTTVPGLN